VRSLDLPAPDQTAAANGIEALYDDQLDVIVLRGAIAPRDLEGAGVRLDRNDQDPGWARPNEKMPVEDLQLLGTDTPATPTYQNPRGASLETYLASAARHHAATAGIFAEGFDATSEIQKILARCSGGRPVHVAEASDGRRYAPFTVRRLTDGKQIGLHHDFHYGLPLYADLAPRLDTRTLISYVVTLRAPESGGELFVYGVTPDTPDAPKLPNGYSWDLNAVEQRYDVARFVMGVGDLFLLASGRCLHRVAKIAGSRARVTMGGFLAMDSARREVLFWS
jgi:hypothetical protein